jgi:hypothetical protein
VIALLTVQDSVLDKLKDFCILRFIIIIIIIVIGEIEWGDMDWIDLAEDRYHWRALINMVMNLRVP